MSKTFAVQAGAAYLQRMRALRMILVLAMLLMPLGMQPAAAATTHGMSHATMPMSHCPEQAPSHSPKGAIAGCTMACSAALPAAEKAADEPRLMARQPVQPTVQPMLDSLHPDTATPPPRLSRD